MTSVAARIDDTEEELFADELRPGTRLLYGQFTVESFLNSGGFGITYLARDSLSRLVVVKECFPASFCRRVDNVVGPRTRQRQEEFRSIVNQFQQEAQNLARLDHPYIVKVHQVFEDNETAYMAMDYIQGPDLLETVEGKVPRLTPQEITTILAKVLEAVGYVHDQGLLHRDISPDNILLDRESGNPVLIDFGASRKEMTRKSRALSGLRVVKDGYSPQEFYIAGSKQAPCSDLYALAASFYHLITGETPRSSQERLSAIANREADPHQPLSGRVAGYPAGFLAAIDKAMSIFPRDRIQSAAEWQAMLREAAVAPLPFRTPATPAPLAETPGEAPAAAPDVTVAAAPVAASPAARRSQSSLLLVAGVALLVLAVALSQLLGRASPPQPTAEQTAALPVVAADAPYALARVVRLPFLADPADPSLVAGVLPASPLWMQPGQRIVEVNGQPVQDGADLPAMLAQGVDLATVGGLKAIIGYEATPGADIVRKMEALPVVVEMRLANGLAFQMVETPTGTQTLVSAVPAGTATDLEVGDVLLLYRATGETMGTTGALASVLQRELTGGVATFGFTVQRRGGTVDASFQLMGDG
ncbi:serine/threonine protein kinase [Tabrizicola sp.]|uniref:serine/threonine protein kinase n=1 Tax=Tabrizicola sp. TaxID=2005166 RepID=UPI0035AF8E52